MFEALQAPLFFGLIAAFVTTLGLLAVALRSDWSLRYADLFGLAAAGMLTTLAFLHIVPEAFALSPSAPIWLALGFFAGLFLHYLIKAVFPEREETHLPSEAITPILAIACHSFIDGVIYSVTFAASFSAGVFAAVGLILHEFPEGVIAFAILRRHGVSNRMSFIWAFLAAAATTPLGVLVSGPVMFGLGEDILGSLFAMSAGLLLFVATGPLMAPLREIQPARGLAALSAGVAIAVALILLPIHGHDHHHFGPEPHDSHDHDHEDHDHSDHAGLSFR
ncbi:MAG: ZIP family metal transporter [Hyphomonadaceae bacterium]|nr:ZIP family metal transporter [Hyphomonadaceae bacterium]